MPGRDIWEQVAANWLSRFRPREDQRGYVNHPLFADTVSNLRASGFLPEARLFSHRKSTVWVCRLADGGRRVLVETYRGGYNVIDPSRPFSPWERDFVRSKVLPRDVADRVAAAMERGESLDVRELFERVERFSDPTPVLCEYRGEWEGDRVKEIRLRPMAPIHGCHLIARECPQWAREALLRWFLRREEGCPRRVLMIPAARCGRHTFWTVPPQFRNAAEWAAASKKAAEEKG